MSYTESQKINYAKFPYSNLQLLVYSAYESLQELDLIS